MATISQGAWGSVVQKDLSLVFLNNYSDFESMLPLIFRFKDAEQGTEYDLEMPDLPAVGTFRGDIDYVDAQEGYKKAVTETEYAQGLKFTRRLLRNDLYGAVQGLVGTMAQRFRALRETVGANVFNNAFGSFTVGDGLSLCNSAHTSRNGGANQSNTGTAALSAANVFATGNSMLKFKSNTDQIITNTPDTLIVPLDLAEKAYEIISSSGKVDTSVNNRNFHEGRYKLIVWPNWLTDADSWFMVNSKRMRDQLVFREWEATEFARSGDFDNKVSKYAGYTSFGISTVEWRWVYGNQV